MAGTLEAGKSADLAAFALDPHTPTHDPMAAAVFSIAGAPARFTAVAGRVLVRDGALLRPRAGLPERVDALGAALAAWLDAGGEMQGVV